MKDDILKRLVTWATGVSTLNGTYTLSKQQHQDLRAMQKDAMEALKPEPPKMVGLGAFLPVTKPAMWHGYYWTDAFEAIYKHAATWTDRKLQWVKLRGAQAEAKLDIYSTTSELDFPSWEPGMRAQGLRRPDEPDYKPL